MERGELMVEKLKRGILVAKRGVNSNSTPSPIWKFGAIQPDGTLIPEFNFPPNSHAISARKLGANLWEMEPQFNRRLEKLSINGSPSKQETSGVKLRNHLIRHNARVDNVGQAQQPLSPASYSSSKEMAPHRSVMSPTSSLVSNSKFGESSHSLKTSTELLKVLNRIWSLEEKHALDMSLVKTLRKELDQSNSRVQELMQEKKRDKHEVSSLMKQLREYKVARKKDQEQIRAKLEDELKLKRHSEKRDRKLAKELSEIKSSFANALRELEQERKARVMMEDLCDTFAKGIRDYEEEIRVVRHESCMDKIGGNDRLILHVSEAWLDERTQMKLADVSEKQSVLDKLRLEIECFLRENQDVSLKSPGGSNLLPHSFHLNEPASAPWNMKDEDDSINRSLKHSTKSRTENMNETRNPRTPRKDETMHGHNCVESPFDPSTFVGPPSPVKRWTSEAPVTGPDTSESSSKWQKMSIKSNTLKAKLLEARQERQQSRTRTSKSLSPGD